jgi:hypothetical protein
VLGVITSAGEIDEIKMKSGLTKARKCFVLADQSMASISLTLWGAEMC